ncbi:hypothetical protein FA95DRAFT_1449933, partial [Auriscalpium vulgare]
LWITGSPTPQEIREKVMDPNSPFQQELIAYLESVHSGQLLTGSIENFDTYVKDAEKEPDYVNPALSLPCSPPELCEEHNIATDTSCQLCQPHHTDAYIEWKEKFESTVDDLLVRLNKHKHHAGCINQKYDTCKSRFPRDTLPATKVDSDTGSIELKHGEAWLNTFTYVLTYVLRCNSDVKSLLSGTAIKSIIAYITDYITKTPLKTHVMFEAVRTVFER